MGLNSADGRRKKMVDEMPIQIAIAICHNMNNPEERAKFTDRQIMDAVQIILAKEDTRPVSKQAYVNALRYVFEKLMKYVKEY